MSAVGGDILTGMSMGRSRVERQQNLWIATAALPRSKGDPFYEKLNGLLDEAGFDEYVEGVCAGFYAPVLGRPSLAPGRYFRLLLVGYFEGCDSERQIAWRLSDSLSLRRFLGLMLTDRCPDHSTLSKTRRRISSEAHGEVFGWVLKRLEEAGLLPGRTVGIDGTMLQANASMRGIVRRDSGEGYQEYLRRLARESGIETPSREDLQRFDRKRKKKVSNEEWTQPVDPSARVARMKDGRTRMAHKVEHAVDLESGALAAAVVQPADQGDTATLETTLESATKELETAGAKPKGAREVVGDKGYHSDATMKGLRQAGVRSYVSEPKRGQRRWEGKEEERRAVMANRRRIRGERGKRLLRRRGEVVERSFAHCYETGGMRRLYLRGRVNIGKRVLIQAAGFNLGLLMRHRCGIGKPRRLQDRRIAAGSGILCANIGSERPYVGFWAILGVFRLFIPRVPPGYAVLSRRRRSPANRWRSP